MNRIYNILGLLLIATLTLMTSCSKEDPFPNDYDNGKTGTVNFRKMLVEVNAAENLVRAATVDVGTFLVEIKSDTNKTEYSGTYAELPEIVTLPVGNYTVTVKSPSCPAADWDTPYYEGAQTFSIRDGEVTFVDPVVCKLANVKVTVRYEADLLRQMGEDCVVTVQTGINASLQYGKYETRSGYFRYEPGDGQATMVATFRGTVENNPEENLRTYTNLAPGNHYIITYSLHTPGGQLPETTGTITPGVSVDATVVVEDMNVNINVDDDILDDNDRPQQGTEGEEPNPPTPDKNAPKVVSTINGSTEYPSPVEVTESMSVKVKVDSETGITAFTVDIKSDTLTPETLSSVNLTDHLDLVTPGQYEAALSGMGFPVNVGGMKDVPEFDISTLVPLLGALGPGEHRFILTVTDANGTTVETLYFITK